MDPSNLEKQQKLQEPRYLDFPHLPDGTMRDGKLALNKYSSTVTNGHDFPGAQVYYVAVANLSIVSINTHIHPRPCSTPPVCRIRLP